MQLTLFRHGIAEDQHPGLDDFDRALTPRGRQRTLEAARGLAVVIDPPNRLITSPKRRAVETAEIAAGVFGVAVETEPILAEASAASVVRWLRGVDTSSVMLVGHEPTFSAVIEALVCGKPAGLVELKKAGAAVLDVLGPVGGRDAAQLLALLPPRVLRALGSSDRDD